MARVRLVVSILIMLTLFVGVSWAEIYKWVDERGVAEGVTDT